MNNVFVYGTLLFPEVAGPVAGLVGDGEPATLSGFRRYEAKTRERGNYPAIVSDPCASTDGLVFRDLSLEQVNRLDAFENVSGNLYVRESSIIEIGNENIEVSFYVAGPRLMSCLLEPLVKSWNPILFQQNELEWYVRHLNIR